MSYMDGLFSKAEFNEISKLRNSETRILEPCSFTIYRARSNYAELRNAVKYFESGTKAFLSRRGFPEEGSSSSELSPASKEVMIYPDLRIHSRQSKVENVFEKLARSSSLLRNEPKRKAAVEMRIRKNSVIYATNRVTMQVVVQRTRT